MQATHQIEMQCKSVSRSNGTLSRSNRMHRWENTRDMVPTRQAHSFVFPQMDCDLLLKVGRLVAEHLETSETEAEAGHTAKQ